MARGKLARRSRLAVATFLAMGGLTMGGPMPHAEQVFLADAAGAEHAIGSIEFKDDGSYALDIDHSVFKDFFLSMKEMKCLEGREIWCHIPYPYAMPREVRDGDYRWLSQDLLFMYKSPKEFGANLWQGIYYRFEESEDGLIGTAMHVDLNELAAPPESLDAPYYDESWLEPVNAQDRWLPALIIR